MTPPIPRHGPSDRELGRILDDYTAAEDALRAFTDRNFGRMCAICARWTMLAAKVNAGAADTASTPGADATPLPSTEHPAPPGGRAEPVTWRLSSWVTNCCNANHALEAMADTSLAGVVASREEGAFWWEQVAQAAGAPCVALTEQGCALKRGRPELCNTYFCEAVRDYLWLLGGDKRGARLAARLDDLQQRWGTLYQRYQRAVLDGRLGRPLPAPHRLRGEAGWTTFFKALATLDQDIGAVARAITATDLAERLFKVRGERALYAPFFERELAAIAGTIRDTSVACQTIPGTLRQLEQAPGVAVGDLLEDGGRGGQRS